MRRDPSRALAGALRATFGHIAEAPDARVLVCRLVDSLAAPGDRFQDPFGRLGPHTVRGFSFQRPIQPRMSRSARTERRARLELLVGHLGGLTLDEVQPTADGRGEVQVKPRGGGPRATVGSWGRPCGRGVPTSAVRVGVASVRGAPTDLRPRRRVGISTITNRIAPGREARPLAVVLSAALNPGAVTHRVVLLVFSKSSRRRWRRQAEIRAHDRGGCS